MNILLIAGGWSPEREISINGAKSIAHAMRELGHNVTEFILSENLDELVLAVKGQDVAFINLHGDPGEDGLVQAMLTRLGLPFQGADATSSIIALHKAAAKVLFKVANLEVANGILLTSMPDENWTLPLKFPVFVKSNTGGSSLHLHRVKNNDELFIALKEIFDAGCDALVEEIVLGTEVTCAVLGDEALPPVLIAPKSDFFDFHNKYANIEDVEKCPAPLPKNIIENIQKNALTAHKILGIKHYSRTDFIVRDDGSMVVLEVNTLPGMTDASLVPKEAVVAGIPFPNLIERLLNMALKENR